MKDNFNNMTNGKVSYIDLGRYYVVEIKINNKEISKINDFISGRFGINNEENLYIIDFINISYSIDLSKIHKEIQKEINPSVRYINGYFYFTFVKKENDEV